MAKVAIAQISTAKPVDPFVFGAELQGPAQAFSLFCGPRNAIHASVLRLRPGSEVTWPNSDPGHLVYVWEGTVITDDTELRAGSVMIIEHGASGVLRCAHEDATLITFNVALGRTRPARAGGHVHILTAERVPRKFPMMPGLNVGAAIYADSDCPTCELWLHETDLATPGFELELHYHDEDEIIMVVAGEIILGQRTYGPGTAVAIARDTIYGFHAGKSGLKFINFRPSRPTYFSADGRSTIDEGAMYRETLGQIQYT